MYDETTIKAVWRKGLISDGDDKNQFRLDKFGWWMQYDKYGDRKHKYGWEIDHIKPKSQGGSDRISNLQPLNWLSNLKKSG